MKMLSMFAIFMIVLTTIALCSELNQDGFGGYLWDTDKTEFSDSLKFEKESSHKGLNSYKTTIKLIATSEVKCNFDFFNNKFYGVTIETKGHLNSIGLLTALIEECGDPHQMDSSGNYYWKTDKTYREYKTQENQNGALVHIISVNQSIKYISKVENKDSRGIVTDGFKGNGWGSPIIVFKQQHELILELEDGKTKHFSTSIISLAGIKVSCRLSFYNGFFFQVHITTGNYTNSIKLLTVLEEVYGEPDKPNKYIDKYLWQTSKTTRVFNINSINGNGSFLMWSNELYALMKAEEKENAKKSIDEF